MRLNTTVVFILTLLFFTQCSVKRHVNGDVSPTTENRKGVHPDLVENEGVLYNTKYDGYQGIWYMNQPLDNEYKFKYSGGLGTYCAKHKPFAIFRPEVQKTFFCYGGTDDDNSTLLHMVSYYDHTTGKVPQPTLLLDKQTTDAHDNPVISMDDEGYIYIFSTSHGTSRPSYIHRSSEPYSIDKFEMIHATKEEDGQIVPMNNFSYMQSWYLPGKGFVNYFTKYRFPAERTICYMTSEDGVTWSEWQRIAAIKKGHYQVSAIGKEVSGSAFNFHPDTPEKNGLNWRTNLYYVETRDFGKTWQTAGGEQLNLPLTEIDNPALVYDYYNEDLNVYMKDIVYDEENKPIILYLTSGGFESGPHNDPRTWKTARWDGSQWDIRDITTSTNNYDMGSLYIDEYGVWRLIAPTGDGAQSYNPGGEIELWESRNRGESWTKLRMMTKDSEYNHTYVRRPLNAHPEFYGFWADGHGRQESDSRLYFCNKDGDVFMLPTRMSEKHEKPQRVN